MKASKQLTLVTEVPHLIPEVKEGWQWHNGHLRMMFLLPSHQHCCYPHHPLHPCIFCHCRGRFYSAIHPALDDYSKAQLIRFWLSSCSMKCMQCNAVQQQCIWTTCVLIILWNKRLVQVWTWCYKLLSIHLDNVREHFVQQAIGASLNKVLGAVSSPLYPDNVHCAIQQQQRSLGESKRRCPSPVVMMKLLLPPPSPPVPKITIPYKAILYIIDCVSQLWIFSFCRWLGIAEKVNFRFHCSWKLMAPPIPHIWQQKCKNVTCYILTTKVRQATFSRNDEDTHY